MMMIGRVETLPYSKELKAGLTPSKGRSAA